MRYGWPLIKGASSLFRGNQGTDGWEPRMKYRYGQYVPFSYKMMIPYLLLVLLTDIIVGYFSYRTAVMSRTELVQTNVSWALRQIRDNTQYQLADLQAVSDSLFSSPAYQHDLQVTGDAAEMNNVMIHSIVPFMETPLKMTAQKQRIIVYVRNPLINEIYGDLTSEIKDKSIAILSMSRLLNEKWYGDLVLHGEDNTWRQVGTDEDQGNISLLRKLISFTDYQTEIGFLRISVPMKELFQAFTSSGLNGGSIIEVEDTRESRVLFSNQANGLPLDESRYLTVSEQIPNTDFLLKVKVPMSVLNQDAGQIRTITLYVCVLSFMAMAGMAILVARYSGRKMVRIVSFARAMQSGNFARRIAAKGNDEFGQISAAFNQMAQNIDELIREVYVQGIEKKEAELQALQAQINPHFLYNTLSSINSLANIGETEKLSAMVSGLVRFYRLTLNGGNIMITIENEINQVKSYLDIQAIKYANRFTVFYEIEPEIHGCMTIKLLLQPFVENVFKHAWFEERIHIRITGRREGNRIVLQIIDDGVGMTTDQLKQAFDRKEESGGYGVRNVNERIKLQYGEEYGVNIFSRLGIGTTVQLILPNHEADS